MHKWIVNDTLGEISLQKFLQKNLKKSFSVKQLRQAFEQLRCIVNNKTERFGSIKLYADDTVEFLIERPDNLLRLLGFEKDKVVYEDESILVYNKPPLQTTVQNGLKELLEKNVCPLYVVHRLDKETSGLVLFAKTNMAKRAFEKQFREKRIEKKYLLLADGCIKQRQGKIDNFLGVIKHYQGQTIWGSVSKDRGKKAVTFWKLIKAKKHISFLECMPITGRTHQLRVHLSTMGHPIIGDVQYGWKRTKKYQPYRCLLHAWKLKFIHPITDEIISLKASIPEDFKKAKEVLIDEKEK